MKTLPKLSLASAIFININIMIGTGLFINTTELAKKTGIFGSLSYAFVGLLLLPLILCIVHLLTMYPIGGFYSFGAQGISSFAGFMSTWCYFFAKLGSVTVGIHTYVLIMQQTFPHTTAFHPFLYDIFIIILFMQLNMNRMDISGSIQSWFTFIKLIPIFFLLCASIFLFQGSHITYIQQQFFHIPSTIPLVLFSLLGFESVCSLSRTIENPAVNASRAVLISYFSVVCIYIAYQFLFFSTIGAQFFTFLDHREAFPALIRMLFTSTVLQNIAIVMLQSAIALSALTAAYGILFSNQWNLYTLAEHKHLFRSDLFMKRNKNFIPFLCMITQGILCVIYLCITQGQQVILQQLAALGCTVTYTISSIALCMSYKKNSSAVQIIACCGLISSLLLCSFCTYTLWWTGRNTLLMFMGIMLIGAGMFFMTLSEDGN